MGLFKQFSLLWCELSCIMYTSLGKPRVDGQAAMPSRVIISDKPATVITSIPPTPKVAPLIRKPNTLLLEVKSEPKKPAPHLQIQVNEC